MTCNDFQSYGNDFQPYAANDFQPYTTNDFQPYANDFQAYDTSCGCYSPTYSNSYTPNYSSSYVPSYASQYMPSYAMQYLPPSFQQSAPFIQPAPVGPRFSTSAAPTNNTNVNPNTNRNSNSNTQGPTYNTNTVTPTNTSTNTNTTGPSYSTSYASTGPVTSTNTNTNTPIATASTGAIKNTNSASTGAITNTFAPVINVGETAPQRLAQYSFPQATCSIYATSGYSAGYGYNQPITLTWTSQNATSAYISPTVGSVAPTGSQIVYPQGYTTYTMTVYGAGGSATCQATANYAANYVAPAPVYTAAPAAPYISLSQIPYTGFDYGPVGDAMYWAALLAFAAAAGYLLVYYRGGALAFAGSLARNPFSRGADVREEEVVENDAVAMRPVIAAIHVEEAPALAARELPTMETKRITSDSMIIDRSASGSPRIVIARA